MGFWDKVKGIGESALDIGTLGGYGMVKGVADGNKYRADETSYNGLIDKSGQNNVTLQDALIAQMNGGGPNLAQQQFENATQQLQQQAAGQIGGIKGINPAAQARMLQQQQAGIAQGLAGQSALQRMDQQLAAQQMLGQQSLGMFDSASARKLGAQEVNAGVTAQNQKDKAQLVGGILNAGGKAATMMYDGGEVPDAPQSELGRMLAGMAEGGEVFRADGPVPGEAEVAGNSPQNDKVPAALSPGEIVIPRTHATPEGARDFVAALQRRQGTGDGYRKVVAARMACGGMV